MIKIIDVHTHIFSTDVVSHRENHFHDRSFCELYKNPKSKLIDGNALLRSMSETGVCHSFCLSFPWEDEDDCNRENEYILSTAQCSKGKLIPFGMVSLGSCSDIKHTIRKLASDGFAGVGEIGFYATGCSQDQEKILNSVFEGCSEEGLVAILHVNEPIGKKYPGKCDTDFQILFQVIERFPELPIILSHWGGGFFVYELMKKVKEPCSSVYYDTAASPYVYDRNIYSTAIQAVGEEKILFGSDYPLIATSKYVDEMDSLSESSIEKICFDNALRLMRKMNTINKNEESF